MTSAKLPKVQSSMNLTHGISVRVAITAVPLASGMLFKVTAKNLLAIAMTVHPVIGMKKVINRNEIKIQHGIKTPRITGDQSIGQKVTHRVAKHRAISSRIKTSRVTNPG